MVGGNGKGKAEEEPRARPAGGAAEPAGGLAAVSWQRVQGRGCSARAAKGSAAGLNSPRRARRSYGRRVP